MTPNRRTVVELAYHLAATGDGEFGPYHEAMTEGRARAYAARDPRSTSCGDLLHCALFAAGCREPWVNRVEHHGWRPGENLSLFVPSRSRRRIATPRVSDMQPGDLGIYDYSNDRAHGFIFLGIGADGLAITADAGQPGLALRRCVVGNRFGVTTLRGRPWDYAIDLDSIRFSEEPEAVGDWLHRHGLPQTPVTPAEYFA